MIEVNNGIIKFVKSLGNKRVRDEEGLFVAEGWKCVRDTLDAFKCRYLVATRAWYEKNGMARFHDQLVLAPKSALERMTQFSTAPDVLAVYEKPQVTVDSDVVRGDVSLVLDNVQDPGNLGTIVRLADWYGIRHLFCSPTTVDIYNHKVVQATMGAIARVAVTYTDLEELFDEYPEVPVLGTFLDGDNIYGSQLPQCAFVVMGNEGQGISRDVAARATRRLLIPSWPREGMVVDSLNVGMATAIVLSELRRTTLSLR